MQIFCAQRPCQQCAIVHARSLEGTSIPLDLALQMIQDRWDEEPTGGFDSESDTSEDPDCCPPNEQGQSDTEDFYDESEEQMDIVSNRMSCKGS